MKAISYIDYRGYDLLHKGTEILSQIECNGIHIDLEYCKKKLDQIADTIRELEKQIQDEPEVKIWMESYGRKFNLDSSTQLADLLFNRLKIEPVNMTEKGNPSTDEESIECLKNDHPFIEKLIQIKRLKKLCSTYISNFIQEQVDGILHNFFHLHTTQTYRSSSSDINFQNIPDRNPELGNIIRRAIIPRQDRMLLELDYSGLEVRVAACYHKDPVMIKEITEPGRDMHRDTAIELFLLNPNDVTSELRFTAKNSFVFAQFYGDYYANCAKNIWNAILLYDLKTRTGVSIREHLSDKGIKTYSDFENHVKSVEYRFWNEKFRVYKKWKENMWDNYQKTGVVNMHTGFICRGLMRRNQVINYPVQGAAFHCLLWSLIHLQRLFLRNHLRSMIVGQIHDSIVIDVVPEELNCVMNWTHTIMTKEIRKVWDWIIVPLDIKAEASLPNESWANKKEIKLGSPCRSCGSEWSFKKKLEENNTEDHCIVCGEITE